MLILLAGNIVGQPQSKPVAPQTEQHIEKLIQLLQPGGDLREILQEGFRGDGVHHPWMDDMRRVGVKKALVLVNFSWKGQAADINPYRILF
jgi:hypothetical protein